MQRPKDLAGTNTSYRPNNKENNRDSHHRTERKSSLGERVGLRELPTNQYDFNSTGKTALQIPRQKSIDFSKNNAKA